MNNYTRILLKFSLWALTGFILILIGITNVKAWTTKTIYSDNALSNSNQYLYSTTGLNVLTGNVGTNYTAVAKAISFYLSQNTVLNNTYKIRINFYLDDLVPNFNSDMVRIYTCNNSSCSEGIIVAINKQNNNGYSTYVDITFNPVQVGSKIHVELGNENYDNITGTQYFGINSVLVEEINTNQDIINNQTNNTNNIINNNNNNTQNIIDNDTSNTQAIIDNQNSSTQAIIDSNKETFNDCYTNLLRLLTPSTTTIRFNGVTENTAYQFPAGTYTFSYQKNTTNIIYTFFRSSSMTSNRSLGTSTSYTITSNENFNIWLYESGNISTSEIGNIMLIDNSYDGDILPLGQEKCINLVKEQEKTSKGILGKLKEIFNGIFDTSGPDTDSLSGMAGWLPPGPVDSILNLPLTFLNNLTTSVGSSCTPVFLPLPFVNKSFELPCFNSIINAINGANALWVLIGTITSVLILYYYLKNLYKWIDNKLSMNEDTDWGGI